MRSYFPASVLFAISICFHLSLSLPVVERQAAAARVAGVVPKYSMVPIDGGSGSRGSGGSGSGSGDDGGSGASPVTVVETVTVPPKATETVVQSSPPETQRVTDTVVFTASPTSVVTQTAILTVDIHQPPPTTTETSVVYITAAAPPSSSSSSPPVSSPTISSSDTPQGSTTSTPTPISTTTVSTPAGSPASKTLTAGSSTFSSVLQTSTTQTSTQETAFPTLTSTSYSSSRTFDDGMWHTTYPAWNGTSIRRFARP